MSDEAGFLAAIAADPDDNTARLVFADWLEEHDQPERAEFIRVQCRLAQPFHGCDPVCSQEYGHGKNCDLPLRDRLQKRELELFALDEHLGWSGFLLDVNDRVVIGRMDHEPIWRRGFIDELNAGEDDMPRVVQLFKKHPVTKLTCAGSDWMTEADTLLKMHPVREVTLTTPPPTIAMSPGFNQPIVPWQQTYRLEGRTSRYLAGEDEMAAIRQPGMSGEQVLDAVARHATEELLEMEWPGVRFNLPRNGDTVLFPAYYFPNPFGISG